METNKEKVKTKCSKISKQNHIIEETSENGDMQYNCTACHKTFRSRSQKYYHLNCNRLQEMIYKCEHCDKSFARHSQWKYHVESHISPVNECSECQKIFSNPFALKKHIALHKVEPKLCPHCDKSFQKKISLEQHIAAQHLNQFQYGCAYCSKKYASKSTLQLHLQTHETKRFECSHCGKLFQRNSILKLHMKRHNNTDRYMCTLCHKMFSESGALARHRKIHEENVLQYHCKLCNTNILRKDNMKRHLNTIHPEEKFCDIVEIIKPQTTEENKVQQSEVDNLECGHAKELNGNFIIIENKLLRKPSVNLNKTSDLNSHIFETSKNVMSNTDSREYPSINQINVITAVPSCEKEAFTTDAKNRTEVVQCKVTDQFQQTDPIDLNNLENINGDLNNSTLHTGTHFECNKIKDSFVELNGNKATKISFNNIQSQNQTEEIKKVQDYNSQEMHYMQPIPMENPINIPEITSNCVQTKMQNTLSTIKTDSFSANGHNSLISYEQPKTQTISSVIRSIGNVKKNLTSQIATSTISHNQSNFEYKHKKYCRNNYNIDLYRKILGCGDDDEEYEHQQQNTTHSQTDHSCDTISNQMTKTSTPVHWRKSFKNNYETSTS